MLFTLVLMWLMHISMPGFQYVHEPVAYAGIAGIFLGIAMAAVSAGMFKKAGTGIEPFDEATVLVTKGFYRHTRNPMYMGMFLMLTGVAFLFGNIGVLLPVFIFILIIRNNFVLGEERFLEASFGQQYLDYKSTVRRWF